MFFIQLEKALQSFELSRYSPVTSSVSSSATQQIHPNQDLHAAVLVLITDENNPQIIFAKRAAHLNTHANEICFPGGKWEEQDQSLVETALRETEEELGVKLSVDQILGVLPARATRNGVSVLPLVARVAPSILLIPNQQELSDVFRVPLFSLNQRVVRVDHFERAGVKFKVPVYEWGEHEIWGFTAAVTQDLLRLISPIIKEIE